MSDRYQRPKASELLAQSNPAFVKKVSSFVEAFPQIEDFDVEVRQEMMSPSAHPPFWKYNMASPCGEYFDCPRGVCYGGGFSIGSMLREMIRERKTDLEKHASCKGYEGSPKGKRRYRDCMSFFSVKIHLKYRESVAGAGPVLAT